jgi:uncharacterized protein (TIGR02266 family)
VFWKAKAWRANKRVAKRLPAILQVEYSFGGEILTTYTINISEGGVFLQNSTDLIPGRRLHLRIRLPNNGAIQAIGQIAWIKPDRHDVFQPGAGVQFQHMTPEAKNKLQTFLAAFGN